MGNQDDNDNNGSSSTTVASDSNSTNTDTTQKTEESKNNNSNDSNKDKDITIKTSLLDDNTNETKTGTAEEDEDTKTNDTNTKTDETKEKTDDKDNKDKDNKDTKKDSKDDDSYDDESINEALKIERAKLKEKLEKDINTKHIILNICFIIDFVLAAMLMMPASKDDYIWWKTTLFHLFFNPFYSLKRLFDSQHDTLDSSFVIIFRVICLWQFTRLAIKWGHPYTHRDIRSDKKTRRDWENSGLYKFGQFLMQCIDFVVQSSVIPPENSEEIAKMHQLMKEKRENTGGNSGIRTNFMDATEDDIIQTYSLSNIVSRIGDYDEQDTADFWKNTIWVLLFTIISLFQAFIGIKIVFFQRSTLFNIGIYTFNILLSHFELYQTQKYIDLCTEPDNKFMEESIHSHPLFKRLVAGHWCDLCRKRIDSMAYRCAKCDFDVCKSCWKNKEKARLAAQNQIRNDSTQDNEAMAKLDKAVTLEEYFRKVLLFHIPYMKSFGLALLILFFKSMVDISQSSKKGQLFDNIINKDIDSFYRGIETYVIFTIINGVLGTFQQFLFGKINESVKNDVQKELFHKTMSQDMVFYDGSTTNNLVERCSWGLDQMLRPFQNSIKTVVKSGTNIIGGLVMCWLISYRLTLLGLSTLGPIAYLSMLFRKWYYQNMRQTWKLGSEVYHLTHESFHNIKTIRSFGKEPSIISHYKNLRNELHNHSIKSSVMNSLTITIMSWFGLAGSTIITWAGGIIVFLSLLNNESNNTNSVTPEDDISFWLNDTLTLGQLMAFELYWNRFKGDIENLRRLFGSFEDAKFKAKQIFRTLEAKPSIELIESKDSNKKEVKDIEGDIIFNDVHFTYQLEPNKEILKGINLKIPKGKTTALVGKSGGGKTTLISLLLRFYDPNEGTITINDSETGKVIDNIKNYNVYSWRNRVALVSQDTELFGSRTMAHNIGFGKEYYNKSDIYYASNLANAHDFINSFDDKYDARIGDRGNKLSGGQKQRISIARMLMKKPSLMLLDEATSALDAESEAIVQAALEQAMHDTQCTVVLVAHRLSTVVNADQICVINDGNVAESGTHDELLAMNGVYAKLVDRQINLKQTMKDKVKEMAKDGKSGSSTTVAAKNLDTIDALLDEINKNKEKEKEKEDESEKDKANDKENDKSNNDDNETKDNSKE